MSRPSGTDLAVGEELPDGTPELQALLNGFAQTLDKLDTDPAIVRFRTKNRRLFRSLPVPAFTRITRVFYLRFIYRCVNALKRDEIRKNALNGDADDPTHDLESLQQFEQSLPAKARLALIWPLALLGVLAMAYVLSFSFNPSYRNLLGDLASALVTLNRGAAIEAVGSFHRVAVAGAVDETKDYLYDILAFSRLIMIVAHGAFLALVPLLSAFVYYRRLSAPSTLPEIRSPALARARRREVEIDLIAYALLIPAVVFLAYFLFFRVNVKLDRFILPNWSAACGILIILAVIELLSRYTKRRYGKNIRRSFIPRVALLLTVLVSLGLLVYSPYLKLTAKPSEDHWELIIVDSPPSDGDDHKRGYLFREAYFMITEIEPHASCHEPSGPLIDHPQFLRFGLETWSAVDRFVMPNIATALLLRNWSVLDQDGRPTKNLFLHANCGRGTDAIAQPMVPGTHTKTEVVIEAPENAACLQLQAPSYHATWVWPIPPTQTCPKPRRS